MLEMKQNLMCSKSISMIDNQIADAEHQILS